MQWRLELPHHELLPWGRAPLEPSLSGREPRCEMQCATDHSYWLSLLGARSCRAFRSRGGIVEGRCVARCIARSVARCVARCDPFLRFLIFVCLVPFLRKRVPFPFWVWGCSVGRGCSTRIILALAFGRGLSMVFVCSSAFFFELRLFATFLSFLNGLTPPR